jgi:hypothetical protein
MGHIIELLYVIKLQTAQLAHRLTGHAEAQRVEERASAEVTLQGGGQPCVLVVLTTAVTAPFHHQSLAGNASRTYS